MIGAIFTYAFFGLFKDGTKIVIITLFVIGTILLLNTSLIDLIKKIKVPKIQVLNHRYHEILSKKCEREFKNKWNYTSIIETFENPIKKRQYESDKELYSHFVDMENKIDQLKRNKLFLLVDRMKYYFDNIEFIFEDDNIKEYELRRKYE